MTPELPTPAAELRAAAEMLRHHANVALMDVLTDPFYESEIIPASDPDGRYAHAMRGGMGGAPGDLGALFTPGAATTLAEWFDSVADLHEQRVGCGCGEDCKAVGCQWCADEDWPCADVRNALALAWLINPKEAS